MRFATPTPPQDRPRPAFGARAGWRLIVTALALVTMSACESLLGPAPVDIEFVGVPSTLQAGQSVPVRVRVIDASGREVANPKVEWSSSDPSAAIVDDGMLNALAPGVVALEARVAGLTARTRLQVRFAELQTGVLALRIQGSGQQHLGPGNAFIREPIAWESLGGDPEHRPVETHIFSASGLSGVLAPGAYYGMFAELFPSDTVLWLALQSAPTSGHKAYTTLLPEVRADGTLVPYVTDRAMLRIRDRENPGRMVAYVAVDRIDVDILDVVAPTPGDLATQGVVRGSVSFEAVGLILDDTRGGNPRVVGQTSGSTTFIYGEFDLPLRSWPVGVVRSTWDDGPFGQGSTLSVIDPAWRSLSGWRVRWVSALWQSSSVVDNLAMALQFDPAQTTFRPLDPETAKSEAVGGSWVWGTRLRGNAGTLVDEGSLYSRDGGLSVERYDAPTSTLLGRLHGRAATTLEVRGPDGTSKGTTVTLGAEIYAPLLPADAGRVR